MKKTLFYKGEKWSKTSIPLTPSPSVSLNDPFTIWTLDLSLDWGSNTTRSIDPKRLRSRGVVTTPPHNFPCMAHPRLRVWTLGS